MPPGIPVLSHLGQDLRHMPYRLGLKLPDHHFEDRHDVPAYNMKCTSELVGPNWFPCGTPDISQVSPINIAIDQVVVAPLKVQSISDAGPYGTHGV